MKNKPNILIIILICLVGYFIFQIYTQNQHLLRFQTSNSQLQKTLEGIISEKKVLEEEKKENSIIISTLTAAKKTNSAEISKLKATQISMENKFMCDKTLIDIDFTDNKSVNNELVKFVNRDKSSISEPVSAHYWSLIWTGEKYSIHTVEVYSAKDRTTYVWKFTAYFHGEAYGIHKNGVFWNDEQCWIYLEE